jgi:hypothetical protein
MIGVGGELIKCCKLKGSKIFNYARSFRWHKLNLGRLAKEVVCLEEANEGISAASFCR